MRPSPPIILLVSLLLAGPALAAPTQLVHGDRAEGMVASAGDEVGFVLDGLAGTEIKIKVKATGDKTLEPEILMSDPEDYVVDFGSRYKHKEGSSKAKLKKFELPTTGRHTIVVRGLAGTTGTFQLKLKAKHPRKFRDTGLLEFDFDSDLTRFSAFAGSQLVFKVKGRNGMLPRVRSLLQPDIAEVNVPGVTTDGTKVRGSTYLCPEIGDYRLRIETVSPLGGEWKSKIKMKHPETTSRTHVVSGEPEGTYTDDMRDPGSVPGLPLISIVQTTGFRLMLSVLDPKPSLAWTSGESMSLMMTLQNQSTGDITVRFNRQPWHNIVVRSVQTSQIVWQLNPNASFLSSFVTFPWADSRSWSTSWDTRTQGGGALPPGQYDIVATFQTDDTRVPQQAFHRIEIR
jgi:hypothetical protein